MEVNSVLSIKMKEAVSKEAAFFILLGNQEKVFMKRTTLERGDSWMGMECIELKCWYLLVLSGEFFQIVC
jgi:hypothetical protein